MVATYNFGSVYIVWFTHIKSRDYILATLIPSKPGAMSNNCTLT